MRIRRIIALAALLLVAPLTGALEAQEAGCRPTDDHVQGLLLASFAG